MVTFILRRALLALLTIWMLSILSFFIIQLPPGDYVDTYIIELMTGGYESGDSGGGTPRAACALARAPPVCGGTLCVKRCSENAPHARQSSLSVS